MIGAGAIEACGLRKSYGAITAVDGVDLHVDAGELFSFVGPNGAGKTTTVELIVGLRRADGGSLQVLGVDPGAADAGWRARIGVVLQTSQLEPLLTVQESVALVAGYYPAPRPVDDTIALVGLTEQANRRAGKLSGGQRRRLDLALAVVGNPELLFLDEPTTGFDPAARRHAWQLIRNLRALGSTIFFTTHDMEEAQTLADRVAVIVAGRIAVTGPPAELASRYRPASRIAFRLPPGIAAAELPVGPGDSLATAGDQIEIRTTRPEQVLHELTGLAVSRRLRLPDLEVARPSLESAYLALTESALDPSPVP